MELIFPNFIHRENKKFHSINHGSLEGRISFDLFEV
jgi:hypothetical protein